MVLVLYLLRAVVPLSSTRTSATCAPATTWRTSSTWATTGRRSTLSSSTWCCGAAAGPPADTCSRRRCGWPAGPACSTGATPPPARARRWVSHRDPRGPPHVCLAGWPSGDRCKKNQRGGDLLYVTLHSWFSVVTLHTSSSIIAKHHTRVSCSATAALWKWWENN